MSLPTGSMLSLHELPTDVKIRKLLEEEEGDIIVMEIRNELLQNLMDIIEIKELEKQAQIFVVECAITALEKTIQMNCYQHNMTYSSMSKESWEKDVPCKPSHPDTWAAYQVPLSYDIPNIETEEKSESTFLKVDTTKSSLEREQLLKETFKLYNDFSEEYISSVTSQDIMSITDYLEDTSISSSTSEEPHPPSGTSAGSVSEKMNSESALPSKTNSQTSKFSSYSEDRHKLSSEKDRTTSAVFSRTALGDIEKGLCMPNVANVPASTVVREIPNIEPYTVIKVDKRKIRVVKGKSSKVIPRRRSDTKLKIVVGVMEESPKEKK